MGTALTEFALSRQRCGLALPDVAAEFGEELETVKLWDRGDAKPPDKVLRTLSVLADFSTQCGPANSKEKPRPQTEPVIRPPATEKAREVNLTSSGYTKPPKIAQLSARVASARAAVQATPMHRYSVISLFSGAMGLDAGLDGTGRFRVRATIEKERSCCATIRANRAAGLLPDDLIIIESDIRDVDPHVVMARLGLVPGELDLLVGGPPCQSFSTAGRRRTTQDARGALLWDFLRFVEAIQPKMFLMENVRGLLSAAINHRPLAQRPERGGAPLSEDEKSGSVIRLFADDLQQIDPKYHMDCFEVNAVNYGAPQLRERALFAGNRFGAQLEFPDPSHGGPEHCALVKDDLFTAPPSLQPWATLRDAIGEANDPGEVIMDFSPRKKQFLSRVPPGSNWRSLSIADQQESMGKAWHAKGGRSGWWRRLSYDLPCPTLVTMPNHASTSLCHPTEVRALSLREYARIQEFPAGWSFVGTAAQQYAQVGNAVPVRLGAIAGGVIAQALDRLTERGWQEYPEPPEHFRTVYIQSHVRTRRWFKAGETFVWDDGGENGERTSRAPVTMRQEKRMAAA